MPAIQIERLKFQIQSILNPNMLPETLLSSMRSFMEAHANLAYRVSPQVLRQQQLQSYQLAPVIINQLNMHITQFSKNNPQIALQFADLLWLEPYIEMKALAGELLGALPEEYYQPALERIVAWVSRNKDKTQRKLIFESSSKTLLANNFSAWQKIIKSWLDSGELVQIMSAIQALVILIYASDFENYPYIFSMFSQINLKKNEKINNAVSELLTTLAEHNPVETSQYIKSIIINEPSPELFRLIRRSLAAFPTDQQLQIRRLLNS